MKQGNSDRARLGRFVLERRARLGLTQVRLAERLGWAQGRISLLEHGKPCMPSLLALIRLAEALEVPCGSLLEAMGYPGIAASPPGPKETDAVSIMSSSPITIAVIDNDADLLLLLGEIVRDRGWKILPCSASVTALAVLRADPPTVILLDLWLDAATTGWTILEKVFADAVLSSIPIVICSAARDQLRAKEQWLGERGIGILTKPFDIDDLFQTVVNTVAARIKRHRPGHTLKPNVPSPGAVRESQLLSQETSTNTLEDSHQKIEA